MANARAPSSDSYISGNHPQGDDLHISDDRNFAAHGEIMMLVLVSLFTVFLLFLVYFLCAKKRTNASKFHQSELASSTPKSQIEAGPNWMPQSTVDRTTQRPEV